MSAKKSSANVLTIEQSPRKFLKKTSVCHPFCPKCGIFLTEPYVRCMACTENPRCLCLRCFAKGQEFGNHKNNHPYVILRNNFSLFETLWSAQEELKLLEAIAQCGFGNWSEISQVMGTKSRGECEKHYLKHYVENPIQPLPPMDKIEVVAENKPMPLTYVISQDPPRPTVASTLYNEMAGYMPGRGDFATEHDDYAELDLKELDFEDEKDPVYKELQVVAIDIYRKRVQERARRKCIMRNYGLISSQKNLEEWRRYGILGKSVIEKMQNLMRLFKPFEFDKFMEGILYEAKLKNRIKLLQECREAGITRLHNVDMYLKLKKKAEERQQNKSLLDNVLVYMKDDFSRQQYFRKQVLAENCQGLTEATPQSANRRSAPPLDISGLPGYEKLMPREKELCASLRLLPSAFLQHKTTLLNEYRKLGSLRLANARAVIKIDVNKTRKIYDLLVEEGLVSK